MDSRTLRLLSSGDRIWVNIPGSGYVGVGKVTGKMQPAIDFKVSTENGKKPILEVAKRATYHAEDIGDSERCEYFVPVTWIQTVELGICAAEHRTYVVPAALGGNPAALRR